MEGQLRLHICLHFRCVLLHGLLYDALKYLDHICRMVRRMTVNSDLEGTEKEMFVEYLKQLFQNFPGKIG